MLLTVNIDEQLADLIDEYGEYEGVAASIVQKTFGIADAEIFNVDGHTICLGIELKQKISLDYVLPELHRTMDRIRAFMSARSSLTGFAR